MKHLEKRPTIISILALFVSSQQHTQALTKALEDTYVLKGTNNKNLVAMISQVTRGHYINFNDEELPFKGLMHNKAFNIMIKYRDMILNSVLVDDGSSLNICPLSTLK